MHEAEAVESAPEGGVEQDFLLHGSPAQARLEDQIAWYDAKSRHNQRWFKLLKVWQIVIAAAIPVAAAAEAPVWLMGGGGAFDRRARGVPAVPAELDNLSLDLRAAQA